MRRMSSRSLLVMMILLGACEAPPGALAPTDPEATPELAISAADLARFPEEGDFRVSPVLEAPEGATRVGALVTLASASAEAPLFEARGLDEHGVAHAWRPLETTFAEADQRVIRVELGFVATGAQLRIPSSSIAAVAGITWSAIVPARESEAPIEGDIGRATEALRAEYASAGVHPRSAWGARATRCTTGDPNKSRMAIHHTVTPSGTDPGVRLRGIQAYHMDTQGWCDIGYHFLISLDGRVWEGRAAELLGTHVASHNSGNLGISFIGCFHSSGCNDWTPFTPPDAMIEAAADMVRLSSTLYSIPINATNVKGHRDHAGATTSCPGDHLHSQLERIRTLAGSSSGPEYRAEYVHQSFPLASMPFELRPNEEARGYLEMRNTGTATWQPGMTFLGTTEPRDGASPIAAPDWISPRRAASIDRTVAPGETGRFDFAVRAPATPGDYPQYFNLVQEGVAWFSDPGQGGPPDGVIQIRVTTLDAPPVLDDAGTPPPHDAGARPDAATPNPDDGGPPVTLADAGPGVLTAGCGCRAAGTSSSPLALVFAMLALGFAIRRR